MGRGSQPQPSYVACLPSLTGVAGVFEEPSRLPRRHRTCCVVWLFAVCLLARLCGWYGSPFSPLSLFLKVLSMPLDPLEKDNTRWLYSLSNQEARHSKVARATLLCAVLFCVCLCCASFGWLAWWSVRSVGGWLVGLFFLVAGVCVWLFVCLAGGLLWGVAGCSCFVVRRVWWLFVVGRSFGR
jgi:hypothetical protein